MIYLKELNELTSKKILINEMISRVRSAMLGGVMQHEVRDTIFLTDHDNRRYTFTTIKDLIGEKEFNQCLVSFEDLLFSKLCESKTNTEKELSKYDLTKSI